MSMLLATNRRRATSACSVSANVAATTTLTAVSISALCSMVVNIDLISACDES